MKTTYSNKLMYIGGGIGIALFGIFGLLPGSFLGGVMGLNIASMIFGLPLSAGALSRLIVAASMVLGVMVSGMMFITVSSLSGWLAGAAFDAVTAEKRELAAVKTK